MRLGKSRKDVLMLVKDSISDVEWISTIAKLESIMDNICREASIPRKWFHNAIANFFPVFAFTLESYSLVGLILVMKVTVIQFMKARACLRNFHEHIMHLLLIVIHCAPKTISTKHLETGKAWEKIKPIVLIIVQLSGLN